MPINPMTGQLESYDPNSYGVGFAQSVASEVGAGVEGPFTGPFWTLGAEYPGMFASAGYSTFRGSNTIMRGGSRPGLFKMAPTAEDFFGKTRGAKKAAAGKTPFVKRSLQQNFPRPRNTMQFTDVSIFAGSSKNMYTPFGAVGWLGNNKFGRAFGRRLTGPDKIVAEAGEDAFGPGLFSFITAGVKTDRLERRALSGSARAQRKLRAIDDSIRIIGEMNNPAIMRPVISSSPIFTYNEALKMLPSQRGGLGAGEFVKQNQKQVVSQSFFESARQKTVSGSPGLMTGDVGVRGNLMASGISGTYTGYLAGYARGALGFGGEAGLYGVAAAGAARAEGMFGRVVQSIFKEEGMLLKGGDRIVGETAAKEFLRTTGRSSFFRQVGAENLLKMAGTKRGAAFLAARAGALAIPGLNMVAMAAFMYDMGNLVGRGIVGGINFARDAAVSLRGSINKPNFGMGYRDTEAAATSRARGVMAIQNSRLNMRSLLGSEASMLAAHYG